MEDLNSNSRGWQGVAGELGKKTASAKETYRVGRCGEGEALTYTVGLWLW